MKKYEHGGAIHKAADLWGVSINDIVDFSANINPLVTSKILQMWMTPYLDHVLHYPDHEYSALYEAVGTHHKVAKSSIALGNGATDLIHNLVKVCKPKTAGVTAPTFGEYEKALSSVGAHVVHIATDRTSLKVDFDHLKQVARSCDMVFICNPNNPTGILEDPQTILGVVESLPDTFFVIDEAFIDFTPKGDDNSLVMATKGLSNLFVLRSATKFYGMPGLRLGYGICSNQGVVEAIKAKSAIWHINVLAAGVVIEGFKDTAFQIQTRSYINQARDQVIASLMTMGLKHWPSQTNYLLFEWPYVTDLQAILANHHTLIRSCDNYHGLPNGLFRMAIKTQKENASLLAIMAESCP